MENNNLLSGSKNLYDICGEILLNSDRTGLFEHAEKYNSGEKSFTHAEYEFLGAMAYFHGIQFTAQRNSFKKETMKHFQSRMTNHKIDLEFQEKFRNFVETVDFDVISKGNEIIKKPFTETIKTNAEIHEFVRGMFNGIVTYSIFPITLSEQVFELQTKAFYTYSDLLMLNKLIYDEFDLVSAKESFDYIEQLYGNKTFIDELNLASKYYDSTKFSMIYVDSIMTLKEWYDAFPKLADEYIDVVVDEIIEQADDNKPTFEDDEVEQKPVADIQNVDPNLTDLFLRSVIREVRGISNISALDSTEELLSIFEEVYNDEEFLPVVYQFVKARLELNRSEDLNAVYGFDLTDFIAGIEKKYLALRADVRLVTEEFLSPLDLEKHARIIELLNASIVALVINGKERKGYLMNQLGENQVETVNHLYQMLTLIEECGITGGNGYENYVYLLSYIELEAPYIKEIFDKVENAEKIKQEMEYYKAVLDFFTKKVSA